MKARCCEHMVGSSRCRNTAAFEFLRAGTRNARWRAVCPECADVLRRNASPLDRLKIRPLEVGPEDDATRRRKLDLDLDA